MICTQMLQRATDSNREIKNACDKRKILRGQTTAYVHRQATVKLQCKEDPLKTVINETEADWRRWNCSVACGPIAVFPAGSGLPYFQSHDL